MPRRCLSYLPRVGQDVVTQCCCCGGTLVNNPTGTTHILVANSIRSASLLRNIRAACWTIAGVIIGCLVVSVLWAGLARTLGSLGRLAPRLIDSYIGLCGRGPTRGAEARRCRRSN